MSSSDSGSSSSSDDDRKKKKHEKSCCSMSCCCCCCDSEEEQDPTEKIGGSSRFVTLLTLVIHGVNAVLNIANYLSFVRFKEASLGREVLTAFLVFSITGAVGFVSFSSIFYMWAWRYPEPEEVAKRRRIYGVVVNLFLSDLPMFILNVLTAHWGGGLASPAQSTNFLWTLISFAYSLLRVWTYYMVKVVRINVPNRRSADAGAARAAASAAPRRGHFRRESRDVSAAADASDDESPRNRRNRMARR